MKGTHAERFSPETVAFVYQWSHVQRGVDRLLYIKTTDKLPCRKERAKVVPAPSNISVCVVFAL